jgi:hypothetical protein
MMSRRLGKPKVELDFAHRLATCRKIRLYDSSQNHVRTRTADLLNGIVQEQTMCVHSPNVPPTL